MVCSQVSETTHQVGRVSVSTGPDVPYKEMARHCEALLMGKQKKMSGLISGNQRQECLTDYSFRNQNDESKAIVSSSYVDTGSLEVLPASRKFITIHNSICSCTFLHIKLPCQVIEVFRDAF